MKHLRASGIAMFALVVSSSIVAAQANRGLLLEDEGRADLFQVGESLRSGAEVREIAPGLWGSRGDAYLLRAASDGTITRIVATSPGVFTRRLIGPGRSTVRDVIAAYGTPAGSSLVNGHIRLDYDRYAFVGRLRATAQMSNDEYFEAPIAAIVLKQPAEARSLELGALDVRGDGNAFGDSNWIFEIHSGQRRLLTIPEASYSSGNIVRDFDPVPRALLPVEARDESPDLRVLGYRAEKGLMGYTDLRQQLRDGLPPVVQARPPSGDEAAFDFEFEVQRTAVDTRTLGDVELVELELQRIGVEKDGSGGSTRWIFEFFLNERLVGRIDTQRYEERAWIDPPTPISGSAVVLPFEPIGLRVVGYRPPNSSVGQTALRRGGDYRLAVDVDGEGQFLFDFLMSSLYPVKK